MILLDPSAYPKGTARHLFHWPRMIGAVENKLELAKGRFLLSDQWATPTIQFVRSLIDPLSEPYFLNTKDDFDLYVQYVMPEAITISRIIDPFIRSAAPRQIFTVNRETKEVFIPTYGLINPMTMSSFKDWYDWEELAPIRLLAHNSVEFVTPQYSDARLNFNRDIPGYLVIGIDIPALFMKYIKYIKQNGEDFETVDRDLFVAKQIIPYIYEDVLGIWCLNIANYFLDTKEFVEEKQLAQMLDQDNEFVGSSTFLAAFDELDLLLDRMKNNRIPIGGILASKLFGNNTIEDAMTLHTELATMDVATKYRGYEILKSAPLINLLTSMLVLVKGDPKVSKLERDVRVEVAALKRSNWSSHMRDEVTKAIVNDLIAKMQSVG